MYNAIKTYISKPTIELRKWMNLEDLSPKPLITICRRDQFDETSANELEYREPVMYYFPLGVSGKNIFQNVLSWGGHRNLTFVEMVDRIYGNYSPNVSIAGTTKTEYNKANFVTVFLVNLGKCLQLSNYNPSDNTLLLNLRFNKEDFDDGKKYDIFVTDPLAETTQFIGEHFTTGDKITINNDAVGYSHAYSVQIENIQKISNCNSYKEESKSDCIANAAWNDFGKNIGCLPPWLRNDSACNGFTKPIKDIISTEEYYLKAYDAMLGYQLYTDKCLTACISNKIHLAYKR